MVILLYVELAEVAYLQILLTSVVTPRETWVVPEGSVPPGVPPLSAGGGLTTTLFVVTVVLCEAGLVFPAASSAWIVYVYAVAGSRAVSEYEVPVMLAMAVLPLVNL